jgi:DNA mismatch repair protein MutL
MATSIQTLPNEVVHLIAAGEVIDSLASVVRELVENSLDAGATRIAVYVDPKQWRVRVADNGCGMSYDDLQNAAKAHSTSKIRSDADLWKIHSLGFRGEALHCLTTLAQLEILSRSTLPFIPSTSNWEDNSCGWRVVYGDGGEIAKIEAVALAPGTVVTVSNLFGNYSARRQGLPNISQQMKAVQAVIYQTALCYPQVAWQIWQSDRIWFSISPAATMGKLLPQILPQIRRDDLQELTLELSPHCHIEPVVHNPSLLLSPLSPTPYSLYLAAGLPDRCHRHRADWVRVAINGRMVKAPELEQTILGAFHRTLPRDRYPVCLLHLLISPEQINWNRNPTKTEIYLNHLSYWQEQINIAIDQALRINCDTVSVAVQTSRVAQLIKVAESKNTYYTNRSIQPESEKGNNIIDGKFGDAKFEDVKYGDAKFEDVKFEDVKFGDVKYGDAKFRVSTSNSPTPYSPLPTPSFLKAVAQINNTYIVVEHPGGMWLIEQHIAHERVLYEQISDNWQLVPIEPPIILYQLSAVQVEQLQRIGLDIETFGEHLWAVRTVPAMLRQREDCNQALLELSLGGDLQTAQVSVACRSAIRNGTPLSLVEMQTLLEQWQRTRNPHTCPHGRPICLSLAESSLSKYFRRNWVIGKSHGI